MIPEKPLTPNLSEESFCIPADVLFDILDIVVTQLLPHEITQVIEKRSLLYLSVYIHPHDKKHQQILQNIKDILEEYKAYRWDENQTVNWRTS